MRKLATELIGFSREFNEFIDRLSLLSIDVILNMLFDIGKLLLLLMILIFILLIVLASVFVSIFELNIFATFLLNNNIFGFNSEKYLLLSIFLGSILHNLLKEHHIKGSISKLFLYAWKASFFLFNFSKIFPYKKYPYAPWGTTSSNSLLFNPFPNNFWVKMPFSASINLFNFMHINTNKYLHWCPFVSFKIWYAWWNLPNPMYPFANK